MTHAELINIPNKNNDETLTKTFFERNIIKTKNYFKFRDH